MTRSVGARAHVLAWVALVLLTGLTLGLSFVRLGPFGMPVALAIAAVKAALVVLVFMHLVEQQASNALALGFGVAMVLLLIGLSALDVATRERAALPDAARVRAEPLRGPAGPADPFAAPDEGH